MKNNIECLIPDKLYYGRGPGSKDLKYMNKTFHYILNVREESKTSHWYLEKLKDEEIVIYSVPIQDIVKTKHKKRLRDICDVLVNKMVFDNKTVYVHCADGKRVAPYVAMILQYWYHGDPAFDPVKDIRKKYNFEAVRSRDQRDQLDEFKEMIQKTMLWYRITTRKK